MHRIYSQHSSPFFSFPWTKEYKKRLKYWIVREVKENILRFKYLKSIDDATKQRLYRPIREHQKKIATIDISLRHFANDFIYPLDAIITILMLITIPFAWSWSLNGVSWKTSGFALLSLILVLILTAGLIYLMFVKPKDTINASTLITILAVMAVLGVVLFRQLLIIRVNSIIYLLILPITITFGLFTFFFLSAVISTASIEWGVRSVWTRKYVDAYLASEYMNLLFDLEQNRNTWTKLGYRNLITPKLEKIADTIAFSLPKSVTLHDTVTRPWYEHKIHQMTRTVQGLMMRAVLPNKDAYNHLTSILSNHFIAFATGQWGDFVVEDIERISRPQKILYIWSIVRNILIAVFPFLTTLILQKSTFAVSGETANYLIGGSIIWGILAFINILDPTFSVKISALKDLTNLLPKK